jgi:taurine dioxygenase
VPVDGEEAGMTEISVKPLQDDLPFGSRIGGVTREVLKDDTVRRQLNRVFEDRGMLVFEDVEPSSAMQLAVSTLFGPLKAHPVKVVPKLDEDKMPGVIVLEHDPLRNSIIELDGKVLVAWSPWHFDHCYNNKLNRAGVLRASVIAPEGGQTVFADGIQLYKDFPAALLRRIEGQKVLYTLDLLYGHMRFGRPKTFRELRAPTLTDILEQARQFPRAIHPAVWTRKSGEKVLHVSPWMAVGLEGHEDPEGDALLEEVSQAIAARVRPYFHQWKPTDMVIWDNWRMLHAVTGIDPKYPRQMHRTTIEGDYGHGYFEGDFQGHEVLERVTV